MTTGGSTAFSSRGGADSHRSLARVIADEALARLPGEASRLELERTVDSAIREESRRMEHALAEVRLGAIALGMVVVGAILLPRSPPPAWALPLLGVLVLWAVPATALLVFVRRGSHGRWMRRLVPLADALAIGTVFMVVEGGGEASSTAVVVGAGAAAVLLAFLGPTRLSRTATRSSALSALALWLFVGVSGDVAAGPVLGIAAAILAATYLGARLTWGVRRLITEQARSSRLSSLYESTQEALEAREQVLGIVCHDLRNPLSTISATAGLLIELPLDEEERADHLRVVERVSDHMNRLIHDLLDVSRIEAGTLAVAVERCRVRDLLDIAWEMMNPAAEENGIEMAVRCPEGLPRVLADPVRIGQVLSNLVGNALKFSPEGSRVTVEANRVGSSVRIAVIDEGPGIPPEDLEDLWKRLWQATPGDRRGLGLGLTIARSIVEAHGERIGVESRVGEGSEFWFTLSLAEVDEGNPVRAGGPGG